MKRAMFEELLASATEALDHAQGKRELRTTVLPPVPAPISAAQVRQLRRRLNASQAVFARYLNVSTKLVQAWEADRRRPDGPALVLLRLGTRDPATLTATAYGLDPVALQANTRSVTSAAVKRSAKRRGTKAA
jgi:putative transcriptional regulator